MVHYKLKIENITLTPCHLQLDSAIALGEVAESHNFLNLVTRQSMALSSAAQNAMPQEFGSKWETKGLLGAWIQREVRKKVFQVYEKKSASRCIPHTAG